MPTYQRRQPEKTLLYQIIEENFPAFTSHLEERGRTLPRHVRQEFEDYLQCGRLENGFLRVRCADCHHERLVAFSCKRRGFCPGCGTRRMVDSATLLVDSILPRQPIRQWVLSFPFHLRLLLASQPCVLSRILGIVYRAISAFLIKKAGMTRKKAKTGALTLIQRFGSALNLNVHFHMLFPDGVYVDSDARFLPVCCPLLTEMEDLVCRISLRIVRYLERAGLMEKDAENCYPTENMGDENELVIHQAHSINYRISVYR